MKTLYKLLNNKDTNAILDLTNFNSLNAEICLAETDLNNNYIDYAYIDYAFINEEHHILSEIKYISENENNDIGIFFKDIDMTQTEKSNIETYFLNISSITLSSAANNSGAVTINALGNPYNTLRYNNKKIVLAANNNIKTSINSYELKNNTELSGLIPATSNELVSPPALNDYGLPNPNTGKDAPIKIESDYTNITAEDSKLILSLG